jgi:hypothetical protein
MQHAAADLVTHIWNVDENALRTRGEQQGQYCNMGNFSALSKALEA